MLTFRAISPAPPFPQSYVVTLDSALILLDCGFPESTLDENAASSSDVRAYMEELKELAPKLHFVFLSHPTPSCLALYPYLKVRCGLKCPVYATLATKELGRFAIEEWVFQKTSNNENKAILPHNRKRADFSTGDPWSDAWMFSRDQIQAAFNDIVAVKWTQPVHLKGPLKGYTMVAYRSGHALGGSILTLRQSFSASADGSGSGGSEASLVYAPVFSHTKERHLDPAALMSGATVSDIFSRASVAIFGAQRAATVGIKRGDREWLLIDSILKTLSLGKNVLVSVDAAARLVELLVLIDTYWANQKCAFPVCLVSQTGRDMTAFLRSLTEWVSASLAAEARASAEAEALANAKAEAEQKARTRQNDSDGSDDEDRRETEKKHLKAVDPFDISMKAASNLLQLKNIRIFASVEEMDNSFPPGVSRLILAYSADLELSPGRDLFASMAQDPNNLVVLPKPGLPGTLQRTLADVWNEKQESFMSRWNYNDTSVDYNIKPQLGHVVKLDNTFDLVLKDKVYLEGDELDSFLFEQRRQAEAAAAHQAMLDRSRTDDESDSDEEDAPGDTANAKRRRSSSFGGAWDEFMDDEQRAGTNFDMYVHGSFAYRKNTAPTGAFYRYRLFPVVERKRRVDAYGEAVDVDGWLRRNEADIGGASSTGVIGDIDQSSSDPVADTLKDPNATPEARAQALAAAAIKITASLVDNPSKKPSAAKIHALMEAPRKPAEPDVESDAPHKFVPRTESIHAKCNLLLVDLDGQSDGRGLATLLTQLNPKRLALVGAPLELENAFAAHLTASPNFTRDIFTFASPAKTPTLVADDSRALLLQIGDSVISNVAMSRVEDYEIGFISGKLRLPKRWLKIFQKKRRLLKEAETHEPSEVAAVQDETQVDAPSNDLSELPVLEVADDLLDPSASSQDVVPLREVSANGQLVPLPSAQYIGDLKLTQLKDRLASSRIPASWVGNGALLCGPLPPNKQKETRSLLGFADSSNSVDPADKVAVLKTSDGHLAIHGNDGPTYAFIRNELYSMHATAM